MKRNYLAIAVALTLQLNALPLICNHSGAALSETTAELGGNDESGAADGRDSVSESGGKSAGQVVWHKWDDELFERARKENKFVLLDLEAVWCHWCHVMDHDTYTDKRVIELMNSKYLAVKVDQDSRPDLSHKYEDYGWPATIIFAPNGEEIVKKAGYINPNKMVNLLEAIIKDPSPIQYSRPVDTFSKDSFLEKALRAELEKKHIEGYDTKYGAWGTYQKFLDWDSVEYAMDGGLAGDATAEQRARQTLTAQLKLMDPVWGGVYQYSTDGDWDHPHFEKIMQMQAENLRVYALGFMLYGEPAFLKAAEDIARYLNDFLTSPAGAFYTSQDADIVQGEHSADYFLLDDAKRKERGIPRVDKHIYTRENCWAINALARLYMASGDKKYLDRAIKAADYIIANRSIKGSDKSSNVDPAGSSLSVSSGGSNGSSAGVSGKSSPASSDASIDNYPAGGFRHDENDAAGPYLGDTLAAGRAFLSLYEATADRTWLERAIKAADFLKQFDNIEQGGDKARAAGFVTALSKRKVARPEPLLDENIMMARFANLLYRYTGKDSYKAMSQQALRYLATPAIARKRRILVAGILLADSEISKPPVHVTVVGGKSDPAAIELFAAALKSPTIYRRVEWFDRSEGDLPNMDVEYPQLAKAAAFSCGDGICSSPAYDSATLNKMVTRKRI